jgi:predicted acyl esterase
VLKRLRPEHPRLFAVGVSLGGNALLKWLGEAGASAREVVDRAAAVSAPVDLMAAGNALDRGFNLLYVRHFLSSMKGKSLTKLARYPGLYDAARVRAARTLRAFDDLVTAPLHGFRNTDDYWTRASAKPWLLGIEVPVLMLNARNDPYLPARFLPSQHEVAPSVLLRAAAERGPRRLRQRTIPRPFRLVARARAGIFRSHAIIRSHDRAHAAPRRDLQGLRYSRHRRQDADRAGGREHRPGDRIGGARPRPFRRRHRS